MNNTKIFSLEYRVLYDLYLEKVVRKDRMEEELLQVIEWLTGYSSTQVKEILYTDLDLKSFIESSPKLNPNRKLVSGKICGIQVEAMEEGLMKEIRIMDKVVDELAKGRALEKILR